MEELERRGKNIRAKARAAFLPDDVMALPKAQRAKIEEWVREARRTGDVEKSKALLVEVFKLLGNSGYGKLIEALER